MYRAGAQKPEQGAGVKNAGEVPEVENDACEEGTYGKPGAHGHIEDGHGCSHAELFAFGYTTRPTQIEIERVVRLAYVRGMTAELEYARRAAADRSDVR